MTGHKYPPTWFHLRIVLNIIFHLAPPLPQTWPDSYNKSSPRQLNWFDQQSMVVTPVNMNKVSWNGLLTVSLLSTALRYITAVKALWFKCYIRNELQQCNTYILYNWLCLFDDVLDSNFQNLATHTKTYLILILINSTTFYFMYNDITWSCACHYSIDIK